MSDLHHVLNDPTQPLESTLSFLFNAGEGGLYFQREIFQYLNIWDARNLRIANRRLDQLVRGSPMWTTYNSQGNLVYTLTPPSNPPPPPIRNSTLHWLGASCNGDSYPGATPCQRGPLANTQVKLCDRISAPLNHKPARRLPCSGNVCIHCVTNLANRWSPSEQQTIARAHRAQLCGQCQLHEAKRHPQGYSSCICPSMWHNRWICFQCRHQTRVQIEGKRVDQERLISNLHRDRQGRKILDSNRRRRARLPCPSCARSFVDRSLRPNHVTYCTGCSGIIVEPTLGPNFVPTNVMPIQPTRWSGRLAAKHAAMAPLNFAPDIVLAR